MYIFLIFWSAKLSNDFFVSNIKKLKIFDRGGAFENSVSLIGLDPVS